MLRSLYSGVSGMRGFQTKLDVIGNNIANVNTVGFKAGRVNFKDILSQTTAGVTAPNGTTQGGVNAKQIGLGSAIGSIDTIHTPGSAMTTNVATDLRIDGDGFFAVKADMANGGDPFLTRDGNFKVDANGNLVTQDGLFVLDVGGAEINLAGVTSFSIASNGDIITSVGGAAPTVQTSIGIAKVTNPSGLEKVGGNLYRTTPNADAATAGGGQLTLYNANSSADGTGAIVTGQLEMSNVDLTSEFTEMIIAQRGFQANSRIITTSDEVLQEVVGLKR
ncbi:flagellar hook-basal body complex protein [Paenibacillus aurantius]|uniref:Flagellar hook protein FlgE n=1 Tax=Paenibacillus aurantius TaxID=2918900 RepID=A0AA96RJX0_9BACL|nr:flagellar hook-basal body complex protein [Paenibacillus aurantius]WNQ13739.1 flagellar hook-basal body complex protein [Paenibacillus aurantius]